MRLIGAIVRLQVQASSLKVGQAPRRRYDPGPVRVVAALTLTPAGVVGQAEDEAVVDVHHRDHPASKNRGGGNGISLGFTAHYAAMRDRFGAHLVDGIAGENLLVEAAGVLRPEDLAAGVVVVGDRGVRLELRPVVVAAPCAEFARFALRLPEEARLDATVAEALCFLHGGMRGSYATYDGAPATVRLGDRVFVAEPGDGGSPRAGGTRR